MTNKVIILYDPQFKIISYGDYSESFDCGSEMDAIVPTLLKLRAGKYSLQEAYDKYLQLKSKGII